MAKIKINEWRENWRDHVAPADDRDHAREETFLRDHARYGATIHEDTAEVLAGALEGEPSATRRHTLALRLFAEFVNALESLGALGWTVRRRREFRLFLDGFLSYPHDAPSVFFRSVLDGQDRSLVDLLALPPQAFVIRALRELLPDGGTARDAEAWLHGGRERLADMAEQYFTANSALLTHYNKAKHGVTMLRLDEHTHDELDFQVIAPQRDRAEIAAGKWYDVAAFGASDEFVARVRRNVEAVTDSIQQVSIIAWAVYVSGAFYDDPAAL